MEIHIKNMVCDRCIMAVNSIFENIGLQPVHTELGKVWLNSSPTEEQVVELSKSLNDVGFELIDDKRSQMIEAIKNIVIKLVHHTDEQENLNLSDILVRKLHHDYSYISSLFSDVTGITIEKYYIRQRTERVKELLAYDDYSVSQIADLLGYSNVAHLSNQFKQVTGMTPTAFKKNTPPRKPLDKV